MATNGLTGLERSEPVSSDTRGYWVGRSFMETEVNEYRQWMIDRGLAERTIEQRAEFAARALRKWCDWAVIGQGEIRAHLRSYRGNSKRTYHDHYVALFRWLTATRRVPANPMHDIERPPKPKPRPRPLSAEDAALSLQAASGDMRAWLMLGRFAGLRAHEIAKFAGEDIDSTSIEVLGKGGQLAILPTHPLLWELAQEFPRRGYWFPSDRTATGHMTAHNVTMRVSRFFEKLGIEGASHRNRHLYGTELLRRGANVRVVQELMRHADLGTTLMYLGVNEAEKVEAIRRLAA